jgi:hypothetical protein
MNLKTWSALLIGVIIGIIATSVYWHTRQERSKFMFDHSAKCQQIAQRYETENNLPTHPVSVLKVTYTPTRNSCVAEVIKPHDGGVDCTVEDLLSGEQLFYGRWKSGQDDMGKVLKEQEEAFANSMR